MEGPAVEVELDSELAVDLIVDLAVDLWLDLSDAGGNRSAPAEEDLASVCFDVSDAAVAVVGIAPVAVRQREKQSTTHSSPVP